MVNPSPYSIVKALQELYGYTFCQRLDIDIEGNTPEAHFQLLVASLLFHVGIDWKTVMEAYEALGRRGLLTPEALAGSSFQDRLGALDEAGYHRIDKDVSGFLGELPRVVMERYNHDVRGIRARAGRVPEKERQLLKEFRGIDDVGADFYCQEVQLVWDEWYPYAGEIALRGARKLGFSPDARALAEVVSVVSREQYPVLAASLLQMEQEGNDEVVLEEARQIESFVEIGV